MRSSILNGDEMNDASIRGRGNRNQGEVGQHIARYILSQMGLGMIEPIHTPWKVLFKTVGGRRKVVDAFPLEKVSGDFRPIAPGGRSVLVEVKSRTTRDTFRWSDLEPHQHRALQEHYDWGGLSLVCWVIDSGECLVMEWPIPGLQKGKSITWDDAVEMQFTGI